MSKYNTGEPNLMDYYFDRNTAIHQLVGSLRRGWLRGDLPSLDDGVLKAAEREIRNARNSIDGSTFPFAQDLSYHVFGGEKRRVVMLVEGIFYGKQNIR